MKLCKKHKFDRIDEELSMDQVKMVPLTKTNQPKIQYVGDVEKSWIILRPECAFMLRKKIKAKVKLIGFPYMESAKKRKLKQ